MNNEHTTPKTTLQSLKEEERKYFEEMVIEDLEHLIEKAFDEAFTAGAARTNKSLD